MLKIHLSLTLHRNSVSRLQVSIQTNTNANTFVHRRAQAHDRCLFMWSVWCETQSISIAHQHKQFDTSNDWVRTTRSVHNKNISIWTEVPSQCRNIHNRNLYFFFFAKYLPKLTESFWRGRSNINFHVIIHAEYSLSLNRLYKIVFSAKFSEYLYNLHRK